MKCPECKSDCRLKMSGAVCTNLNCGWYTGRTTSQREIETSSIGRRFKELEVQAMMDDYEDYMEL